MNRGSPVLPLNRLPPNILEWALSSLLLDSCSKRAYALTHSGSQDPSSFSPSCLQVEGSQKVKLGQQNCTLSQRGVLIFLV